MNLTNEDPKSEVTYEMLFEYGKNTLGVVELKDEEDKIVKPGEYFPITPKAYKYKFSTGDIGRKNLQFEIKDSNGRDIILATIQDITKRKDMENSLVEAKLKAEAASKSKSEFLANMSHEIRTPLNGVIGFTDLLMKTELNASQKQYMETVYNSANTLLDLINDILDFSKIEAGKLELSVEKVNLIELCGQTVDVVKHKAHEKGLEVLLNISPDVDRYIYGDSVRIRQILTNLLGNSVKFTNQGEIELRIEAGELNQENKREYTFIVRDTGIGIAPQNLERIFKAFDQEDASTTRKYGGTGLGLTISNKLLYLMDSKLNLSSELGVGSTFSFKVCFESEGGESFLSDNLGKIKDVLVIDDNYNNQVILKEMLAMEDINCDAVSNAIEALNVLEKENKYQLAIVDYNMPYLNGLDLIQHFREDLNIDKEQLPVILLHSSEEDTEINGRTKALGVAGKLVKPALRNDLFETIDRLDDSEDQAEESAVDLIDFSTSGLTILVAEDNPVNKFLTKTILNKITTNANIVEVEDGQEAVEAFQNQQIDFVFMDIQMPVMSGYKATQEIRKLEQDGQRVPIIALTARALKGEHEKCLQHGMDGYIAKPLVLEDLKEVMLELLTPKT